MRRRRLFFTVLILLLTSIAFFSMREQGPEKNKLIQAASRGAQWLLAYDKPVRDPGVLWAMHEMNQGACFSAESERAIAERFDREFGNDPVLFGYRHLIDTTSVSIATATLAALPAATFDDILLPSLYCDIYPVEKKVVERIRYAAHGSRYNLTHAFLAVEFMRRKSCEEASEFDRADIARRMSVEAEAATQFSDLLAEQAALLHYGGFKDLVPAQVTRTVVAGQEKSGAWKGPFFETWEENPYATVLATWALAQSARSCPFKDEKLEVRI